jgi:hypothetical protein
MFSPHEGGAEKCERHDLSACICIAHFSPVYVFSSKVKKLYFFFKIKIYKECTLELYGLYLHDLHTFSCKNVLILSTWNF